MMGINFKGKTKRKIINFIFDGLECIENFYGLQLHDNINIKCFYNGSAYTAIHVSILVSKVDKK